MSTANLTKIHVDLPCHCYVDGEALWAEELGGDLFRIGNVPFFAYGLNFADVVRATPDAPGGMREVREVVERSGHQTMRVFFVESFAEERRVELLRQLRGHRAYFERATALVFAIDIEPIGSYDKVYEQLLKWEEAGYLFFETCEERVPGSFDDHPTVH